MCKPRLLPVWALVLPWLVSASLWADGPAERMYPISESELTRLLQTSARLEKVNETLLSEQANSKQTLQRLESSLLTASNELAELKSELSTLRPQLTELGEQLATSELSATEWMDQAQKSEALLAKSEQSMTQLSKDLLHIKKASTIWRTSSFIALIVGAGGWVMFAFASK